MPPGRKHGSKNTQRAIVTCPECGDKQEMTLYQASRFRYCSRRCSGRAKWVSRKGKCKPLPIEIIKSKPKEQPKRKVDKVIDISLNRIVNWYKPIEPKIKSRFAYLMDQLLYYESKNLFGCDGHLKVVKELNDIDREDIENRTIRRGKVHDI